VLGTPLPCLHKEKETRVHAENISLSLLLGTGSRTKQETNKLTKGTNGRACAERDHKIKQDEFIGSQV